MTEVVRVGNVLNVTDTSSMQSYAKPVTKKEDISVEDLIKPEVLRQRDKTIEEIRSASKTYNSGGGRRGKYSVSVSDTMNISGSLSKMIRIADKWGWGTAFAYAELTKTPTSSIFPTKNESVLSYANPIAIHLVEKDIQSTTEKVRADITNYNKKVGELKKWKEQIEKAKQSIRDPTDVVILNRMINKYNEEVDRLSKEAQNLSTNVSYIQEVNKRLKTAKEERAIQVRSFELEKMRERKKGILSRKPDYFSATHWITGKIKGLERGKNRIQQSFIETVSSPFVGAAVVYDILGIPMTWAGHKLGKYEVEHIKAIPITAEELGKMGGRSTISPDRGGAVYLPSGEVLLPKQVYEEAYSGGELVGSTVALPATIVASEMALRPVVSISDYISSMKTVRGIGWGKTQILTEVKKPIIPIGIREIDEGKSVSSMTTLLSEDRAILIGKNRITPLFQSPFSKTQKLPLSSVASKEREYLLTFRKAVNSFKKGGKVTDYAFTQDVDISLPLVKGKRGIGLNIINREIIEDKPIRQKIIGLYQYDTWKMLDNPMVTFKGKYLVLSKREGEIIPRISILDIKHIDKLNTYSRLEDIHFRPYFSVGSKSAKSGASPFSRMGKEASKVLDMISKGSQKEKLSLQSKIASKPSTFVPVVKPTETKTVSQPIIKGITLGEGVKQVSVRSTITPRTKSSPTLTKNRVTMQITKLEPSTKVNLFTPDKIKAVIGLDKQMKKVTPTTSRKVIRGITFYGKGYKSAPLVIPKGRGASLDTLRQNEKILTIEKTTPMVVTTEVGRMQEIPKETEGKIMPIPPSPTPTAPLPHPGPVIPIPLVSLPYIRLRGGTPSPRKKSKYIRPLKYAPSISASILGITTKRKLPAIGWTGLEIRPIVVQKKKGRTKRKKGTKKKKLSVFTLIKKAIFKH